MTAIKHTRVSSDNSVSQSATLETNPWTRQVVQIAVKRNKATSSDDIEGFVGQLCKPSQGFTSIVAGQYRQAPIRQGRVLKNTTVASDDNTAMGAT